MGVVPTKNSVITPVTGTCAVEASVLSPDVISFSISVWMWEDTVSKIKSGFVIMALISDSFCFKTNNNLK